MLNELANKAYTNALNHGFYEEADDRNVLQKLMLIVSELGEACEAHRKVHRADLGKFKAFNKDERILHFTFLFEDLIKDSFEDEIADTIIRLFDLCGFMGIDIDKFVELKMQYNETRPYKHGKIC